MGAGKTTIAARSLTEVGSALWLCDRHEDAAAAAAQIESHGGVVGRVLPLRGETAGVPHCLHPETVELWQARGYHYQSGFCRVKVRGTPCCERGGRLSECPYLNSIVEAQQQPVCVTTKAFARRGDLFHAPHRRHRRVVVLDEDPVALLRPAFEVSREDLRRYMTLLDELRATFAERGDQNAYEEAAQSSARAKFLWDAIARQPAVGQPEVVRWPAEPPARHDRRAGARSVLRSLHAMMRREGPAMVRNVYGDLDLLPRAVGGALFVTSKGATFHVAATPRPEQEVWVLDATANADLLRPIFAPRAVEVLFDERVAPAGRVVQFMDFNGPRSYLNKSPKKVVRIIDAIGDLHPHGAIVLISHRSCVEKLRQAARHAGRIKTAYFGAIRGRNDLEPGPGNHVACHVVIGSPKTSEEARQQLALAVYGEGVLPFPDLEDVRRGVIGPVLWELAGDTEAPEQVLWEVRIKGYTDPRMQAVYDHTVTAELTHAADRARVLLHESARVYLVTNEPCPKLWFAERCFAGDFLDLSARGIRADFEQNYQSYKAKAMEVLNAGGPAGNADVCRALGRKATWGHRYWRRFIGECGDALEGDRKVRWKHDD